MEKGTSFTEGKILKPLILFALPVRFALCLQTMYGAVDLMIVGKFASSADVSAVSTGSQIMMTLTSLVSSFAMGTTILLGQQIGCGGKGLRIYHADFLRFYAIYFCICGAELWSRPYGQSEKSTSLWCAFTRWR